MKGPFYRISSQIIQSRGRIYPSIPPNSFSQNHSHFHSLQITGTHCAETKTSTFKDMANSIDRTLEESESHYNLWTVNIKCVLLTKFVHRC